MKFRHLTYLLTIVVSISALVWYSSRKNHGIPTSEQNRANQATQKLDGLIAYAPPVTLYDQKVLTEEIKTAAALMTTHSNLADNENVWKAKAIKAGGQRIRDTIDKRKNKNTVPSILARYDRFFTRIGIMDEEKRQRFAELVRDQGNLLGEVNVILASNVFASREEAIQWAKERKASLEKEITELIGDNNLKDLFAETARQIIFDRTFGSYQERTEDYGCPVSDVTMEKLTDIAYNAYIDARVRYTYSLSSYPLNSDDLADEVARRSIANEIIYNESARLLNERQLQILKSKLDGGVDMLVKVTIGNQNAQQRKQERANAANPSQ